MESKLWNWILILTPMFTLWSNLFLKLTLILFELLSQWLYLSSLFSSNRFYHSSSLTASKFYHFSRCTFLSPVTLRRVVDCAVAHNAVIQCYWGCNNSVLCEQEPQSPDSTLWKMTKVRFSVNESHRGCDETHFLILTISGWLLRVLPHSTLCCVCFSISELLLQNSINIRCDQSTRDLRQIPNPCWDDSFVKCYNVRLKENHSFPFILHWQWEIPVGLSSHFSLSKGFNNTDTSDPKHSNSACHWCLL